MNTRPTPSSPSRTRRRLAVAVTAVLTAGLSGSLAATSAAAVSAPAATVSAAEAAAAAKASKGTALDTAALQARVEAVTAAGAVGVVAAVDTPAGSFEGASGYRNREKGLRAAPQDRARVSSITKPMTAVMVMQEIEAGHWTLNTTIDDVYPGLYPGHGDITVGQLLNHTSGMPDAIWRLLEDRGFYEVTPDLLDRVITRTYDEEDIVAVSRQMPWWFEPGTNFGYSNTGYVVLGLLLERQNGMPYEKLMDRRVFKPAKMNQTWAGDSAQMRGRGLTDYGTWGAGFVPLKIDESIFSAAGSVYATADDVTDFLGALTAGRLVSKQSLATMTTPVGAAAPYAYGYGLYLLPDPCPAPGGGPAWLIGHDGAGFGSQAVAFTSPDGTRRAAMGWTGRSYVPGATPPPVMDFLASAFTATCSAKPVNPAPAVGAGRAGALRF